MFGCGKGELAFADGDLVRVVFERLEVTLFEKGEFAADVSGVDGDVELVEGRERREWGKFGGKGDF